jgi:hypothetical protein
MCSCQFSFCFSIVSVKLNIFILNVYLYFVFDLGECIQLLNVGTSFQRTLFSFCLSDLLSNFRLHKSAWALPLFYKILGVCFAKFFCLNVLRIVPHILWNLFNLIFISSFRQYDTLKPEYLKLHTCSIVLLSITILHLMWFFPWNAMVYVFVVEILILKPFAIFSSLLTALWRPASDSLLSYYT